MLSDVNYKLVFVYKGSCYYPQTHGSVPTEYCVDDNGTVFTYTQEARKYFKERKVIYYGPRFNPLAFSREERDSMNFLEKVEFYETTLFNDFLLLSHTITYLTSRLPPRDTTLHSDRVREIRAKHLAKTKYSFLNQKSL